MAIACLHFVQLTHVGNSCPSFPYFLHMILVLIILIFFKWIAMLRYFQKSHMGGQLDTMLRMRHL
jgi:hypothetical protein